MPRARPLRERLFEKIQYTDTCWIWTACRSPRGYGHLNSAPGRTKVAHRLVYEELVGPIPEGMELDHLCRNTSCVNPAHLEPVPHRVNVLRGVGPTAENAVKTECVNGHPLTGRNLCIRKEGGRKCRTCLYAARDRWIARNQG